MSSGDYYQSRRWRSLRERILRRDKYLCQDCKRYGRRRSAAEVHHIKPREEWPELQWDPNNLISLCNECHNKRHPEKGGARFENFSSDPRPSKFIPEKKC